MTATEINEIEVNGYEVINSNKIKRKLSLKIIEKVVCDYFNIRPNILFSRTRLPGIVEKRQMFHFLCKLYSNECLSSIGNWRNGGFSHSSVLHSYNKTQNMIDTEPYWQGIYNKITDELRNIQLKEIYDDGTFDSLLKEIAREVLICDENAELNAVLLKYIVREIN